MAGQEDVDFSDRAASRAVVAERGVPVVWTYIGLEEGLYVGFPGTGGFPPGYDPRVRPWYRLSARTHGPRFAVSDGLRQRGFVQGRTTALRPSQGRHRGPLTNQIHGRPR